MNIKQLEHSWTKKVNQDVQSPVFFRRRQNTGDSRGQSSSREELFEIVRACRACSAPESQDRKYKWEPWFPPTLDCGAEQAPLLQHSQYVAMNMSAKQSRECIIHTNNIFRKSSYLYQTRQISMGIAFDYTPDRPENIDTILNGLDRYNPGTTTVLQEYVTQQCEEQTYDCYANLALLKL